MSRVAAVTAGDGLEEAAAIGTYQAIPLRPVLQNRRELPGAGRADAGATGGRIR